MPTDNMTQFIDINSRKAIVFGERKTPDGGAVQDMSDMEKADRNLYRFEDGEVFVLLDVDKQSSPDYEPKWLGL